MSDWTHAEYKQILGFRDIPFPEAKEPERDLKAQPYQYKTSIDHRTLGHVNPIKD